MRVRANQQIRTTRDTPESLEKFKGRLLAREGDEGETDENNREAIENKDKRHQSKVKFDRQAQKRFVWSDHLDII